MQLKFRLAAILVSAVLLLSIPAFAAEQPAETPQDPLEVYMLLMNHFGTDPNTGMQLYPDGYGGEYIDEDGFLNVCLVDMTPELEAEYLELCGWSDVVKLRSVDYSINDLNALSRYISANFMVNTSEYAVLSVGIAPQYNAVNVGIYAADREDFDRQLLLLKQALISSDLGNTLSPSFDDAHALPLRFESVGNIVAVVGYEDIDVGSDAPEEVEVTYTVKRGDTLGHITTNFYGDNSQRNALYRANSDAFSATGGRLEPGMELVIPEFLGSCKRLAYPEAAEGESLYTVKSGDTLSGIALSVYGDMWRYTEIFERNSDRLKNADTIYEGQVIVLPAK